MKVNISYNKKSKDTVKVSVEERDLWSADVTLARVIYPILKKYRKFHDKNNAGFPMDFSQDPTKPEGPDNCDRYEDWIKCLDAMVYYFEWIAKDGDWDGPTVSEYHKECDRLLAPHKKELKKLEQEDKLRFAQLVGPGALPSLAFNRRSEITRPAFDKLRPEAEKHRQKNQNDLDLFAKYFGALWT
ncbi:MAG: hypothetical protein WC747_01080 [Candidatus Babeliales bacterium]|jgi:hypothetical protein